MLDIKFIRDNAEAVAKNAKDKGYEVDISKLLELDAKRRGLLAQTDELREKRNAINEQLKGGGRPSAEVIEQGKVLKDQISELEQQLKPIDDSLGELTAQVPNMMQADVPIGAEEDSVEIKKWGEQQTGAVDHLDFAVKRDWVD